MHLPSPTSGIVLTLWFGMLAGFLELLSRGVRKVAFDASLEVGLDTLWMTPLANVLLFAAVGAVGLLVRLVRPDTVALRGASFVYATLCVLAAVLHFPAIHPAAAILLAVGVAHQVARRIDHHAARFRAIVRASVGAFAVVVLVAAGVARGWWWLHERRATASLPAPPPGAKNVLLIVMDTVRAESTSLCGHTRPTTPYLDDLARTATRFDLALATSPWTLPSHGSMFTGRYPHELSISSPWMASRPTPLDGTHPVLAEVLAACGYRTGGFVANLHYCCREFGLDRGFAHYEDYATTTDELLYHSIFLQVAANSAWARRLIGHTKPIGFKSADDVNRGFLGWLDTSGGRPFFAFLNYMDAHDPYFQPPPYDTRFTGEGRPPDPALWMFHERSAHRSDPAASSPAEVRAQVAAYEGGIAAMDDAIRRVLADLERRGALADTVVIVTSDHGEQFLEHGVFGHARSVYRVETHVPLLIRFPRQGSAERRVGRPVTLRDLPATIMDALDLEGRSPFPGHSLVRADPAGTPHARAADASPCLSTLNRSSRDRGEPELHALAIGRHRAIFTVGGGIELYDLDNDPRETNDLARSPAGDRLLEPFQRQLRSILGER